MKNMLTTPLHHGNRIYLLCEVFVLISSHEYQFAELKSFPHTLEPRSSRKSICIFYFHTESKM